MDRYYVILVSYIYIYIYVTSYIGAGEVELARMEVGPGRTEGIRMEPSGVETSDPLLGCFSASGRSARPRVAPSCASARSCAVARWLEGRSGAHTAKHGRNLCTNSHAC